MCGLRRSLMMRLLSQILLRNHDTHEYMNGRCAHGKYACGRLATNCRRSFSLASLRDPIVERTGPYFCECSWHLGMRRRTLVVPILRCPYPSYECESSKALPEDETLSADGARVVRWHQYASAHASCAASRKLMLRGVAASCHRELT